MIETRFWSIPKECAFMDWDGSVLQVSERQTFQSRTATLSSLIGEALPRRSLRFLVNLGDRPIRAGPWWPRGRIPVFGAASCPGFIDIAAPDFVVGGWPESGIDDFDETCSVVREAGSSLPSTDLLGWYGNCGGCPSRQKLVSLASSRADLCELVDTSDWHSRGHRLRQITGSAPEGMLTLPDQVARFAFLIDVEGVGYSGRLKVLLHSGRPVLIQDRPWRDWFLDKLVPWVHYAPVARDLSDLFPVLQHLRQDRSLAESIGQAGQSFARVNLTRKAAVNYWRALLENL